jgi:aspartyl-tRNA(Asn)/glutamyl-tRNA(Gln) amidotransferase subunit B
MAPMKSYTTTIGLEIHAELKTATKMFCNSKNDPEEKRPNVNICPICMGHPGTLPVINKEAVKHVLKVGAAVGGDLADFTEFDRKNYFYPDIPKGYQLSQYKYPLVSGGLLNGVAITRVHLEEDTARSTHEQGDYSLVDFNRAGLPLMELVTEPVIHSAEEASAFARELQLLLQCLGVAEANMEKGEMRVEANISVSTDAKKFGTKVEVKNLNSFKAVEKAIAFEVKRHIELLEKGGAVVQETRGWDENREITFSQRQKEDSHDYRYFPDPDLPKLKLSEMPEFSKKAISAEMPELPWQKRDRYKTKLGLKNEDAELYVRNPAWGTYFELVIAPFVADAKKVALASNYLTSDLLGMVRKEGNEATLTSDMLKQKIAPADFAHLMDLISAAKISSRGAKDILKIMYEKGGQPLEIAEAHGLLQKNDEGEIKKLAQKIIDAHPDVVADYKKGKAAALQFFIGQAMKETKGSANPQLVKDTVVSILGK